MYIHIRVSMHGCIEYKLNLQLPSGKMESEKTVARYQNQINSNHISNSSALYARVQGSGLTAQAPAAAVTMKRDDRLIRHPLPSKSLKSVWWHGLGLRVWGLVLQG